VVELHRGDDRAIVGDEEVLPNVKEFSRGPGEKASLLERCAWSFVEFADFPFAHCNLGFRTVQEEGMNIPMPENRCPQCGALLGAGAAQGLCPRCLLAGAAEPTEQTTTGSAPPTLEQVAVAFPQLEVVELIGQGGMGAVFKVRQPKLDRYAALKILPHSLAADPTFASRFEREARLLARLNHANIVAVYDHGQTGEFFYLLMEFVDGVNLRQAMRASRFTPDQALGIVPKICEALQYAHDEGVLHRDIKPENILLDAKGRVKLADFGIAKLVARHSDVESDPSAVSTLESRATLTQAGAALGTPYYMAPEQRDTPSKVDHRADIYSLGVVFYELLTGELPVGVFVPPSAKSAADPRVDAIVAQSLQKERERRQHSAAEVKTQVEAVATSPGRGTPPPLQNRVTPAAPAPMPAVAQNSPSKTHIQIVAVLHICFGAIILLGAVAVVVGLGIPFGITLSQGDTEAPKVLGIIGFLLVSFLAILSLPGIIGGWGLFTERSWGKPVVLVLSVLHLFNIPFGTALGIYSFWALLRDPQPQPSPVQNPQPDA
jgi:serine/threonine protein kinase